MTNYYLTYDLDTRVPQTLSGAPIDPIPPGHGSCLVHTQEGEDFILGNKSITNYLVTVVDGYAEFGYRWNIVKHKKYKIDNNIVQDLNYNINFITNLDIKFDLQDSKLTLLFDLNSNGANIRNNFNTSINEKNGDCVLYVTKYQEPTALLESFDFDIYQLSQTQTQTFDLTTNCPISLWVIRK